MNLLVVYDVSTETKQGVKRLRRVAQLCVNFGQRVQHSVFECRLDELALADFIRQLREIVHPAEDNIRLYRVADFTKNHVVNLGKDIGVDYSEPMIL